MAFVFGASAARDLSMRGPEIDRLNVVVVLDLLRRAFLEDPAVMHDRHIGRDAPVRAKAISSWRCWPWLRVDTGFSRISSSWTERAIVRACAIGASAAPG